jgi:hypothetical protein
MAGAFSSPETARKNIEQQERNGQSAPIEQASTPSVAAPILTQAPVLDTASSTPQSLVTSPTVASDDDLIEKEWVDRAKKVLAETKDDPYRREQEVSRLQADYLEKRYGRKLGRQQ